MEFFSGAIIVTIGIGGLFFVIAYIICYLYDFIFRRNYGNLLKFAIVSTLAFVGLMAASIVFLFMEVWKGDFLSWFMVGIISCMAPFVGDALTRGLPALRDWMMEP